MSRFLFKQCEISDIAFPKWARKWINIRKVHANYYAVGKPKKIMLMLDDLGLEFEGSLHSGIDDTRNIARIALSLLEDGCDIVTNERLLESTENEERSFASNYRRKKSEEWKKSNESKKVNLEDDRETLASLHSQVHQLEKTKTKKRVRRKEVAPEQSSDEDDTESLLRYFSLQT